MKTDAELVQLASDIYYHPEKFDVYQPGTTDKDVVYGIIHATDETVISLRGSLVLRDWVLDLNSIADPFMHGTFGPVHPGFISGMEMALADMLKHVDLSKPLTITGHSLGAGRAVILTALLLAQGVAPGLLKRVVVGEPKAGFQELAEYVKGVEARSYRNGDAHEHDPVTSLPFSFPPEEYVHPGALLEVCAPPHEDLIKMFSVFGWHHVLLYVKAVGNK